MKRIVSTVFCIFFHIFAFSQGKIGSDSGAVSENSGDELARFYEMLTGYLANDSKLQQYLITQKSKELDLKKTEINNGIAVKLSSGTMTFQQVGDTMNMKFSPNASIEIPQANKTSISVSFPVTVKSSGDENTTTLRDAKISVSTGIITEATRNRKIAILESERSVLEAKRAVENQALAAEKNFYTELKDLYNSAVKILTAHNNLYDDELSLQKIVTQGYSASSSSYRMASSKVASDKRSIEVQQRRFEQDLAVFAKKCGIEYKNSSENSAMAFLPVEIPTVEGIDIKSFSLSDYTKMENAVWKQKIAEMKREAKRNFTLSANAGFTFGNTFGDGENSKTFEKSDTVDVGLSAGYKGLTVSPGVSLPVNTDSKTPTFTLSLGFVPNTMRLSKITDEQDKLDIELENFAIKDAENDWESDVLKYQSSLGDAIWAKKTYEDDFEMYSDLEKDMSIWLAKGVVTEKDWGDARDNKNKAHFNILISKIDIIVYNVNVRLLFVPEAIDGLEAENEGEKEVE